MARFSSSRPCQSAFVKAYRHPNVFLSRRWNAPTISSQWVVVRGRHPSSPRSFAPPAFSHHIRPALFCSTLVGSPPTDAPQQEEQTANEEAAVYQELVTLSSEIVRHDQLYYEVGIPEITDDVYDGLCQRERDLCQQFPHLAQRWIEQGGSTRESRVGIIPTDASNTTTRRMHLAPMLSLDNVHSTEELLKWLERIRKKVALNETLTLITEPKLDGLSISLRYDNEIGKLLWAATRGDGSQGQDVTAAALEYIAHLPKVVNLQAFNGTAIEVRGEVVLPKSTFQKLQNDNDTSISNARNAAAGMLLRKQPADSTLPHVQLQFYAYDVTSGVAPSAASLDGLEVRQWLTQQGFKVPTPSAVTHLVNEDSPWTAAELQSMLLYVSSLQEHRQGVTQATSTPYSWDDYDMDGCVHKVVPTELRYSLGTTSRAPRWAIAHKLPATVAITRLTTVTTQVGRTGALTPVAELEPVTLDGVVVQRATLHNFQHLQKLLGSNERIRKNTLVWIRRSGDVIPQVFGLVDQTDQHQTSQHVPSMQDDQFIAIEAPMYCPACGSKTVFETLQSSNSNSTVTGQVVRCGGPALLCPPRATLAVKHAFSREALDITGLSEARIKQLMDNGFVKFPCDLFKLVKDDSKLQQLAALEGWGELSVKKLKSVTERVADVGVPLDRFIYSLSIRSVGAQTASLLALAFGSVDVFWREVDDAARSHDEEQAFSMLREDRNDIKGIGPALLSSLLNFSNDSQMTSAGKELSALVPVLDSVPSIEPKDVSLTRPWQGMSVVFTGSLSDMSRTEAEKIAKEVLGAKSTPKTLSKSTDLVVMGQKSGKKAEQARELGIRTITHPEFLKLIETAR